MVASGPSTRHVRASSGQLAAEETLLVDSSALPAVAARVGKVCSDEQVKQTVGYCSL